MSMFKDTSARRDLALALLHEFKEFFYPPGQPFNEQNVAMIFKSVFIVADIFAHVESVKKEDLMSFGRAPAVVPPHMQPVPQHMQAPPNGAPRPVHPTPQAAPVVPIKPPEDKAS